MAARVNPPAQRDGGADVLGTKVAATVRAQHLLLLLPCVTQQLLARDALLFAGGEVLERDLVCIELVVAENHGPSSPRAVGRLHLTFHAPAHEVPVGPDPGPSQLRDERQCLVPGPVAESHDEDLHKMWLPLLQGARREQEAVDAQSETDAGQMPPAQ